MKRSATAVWKGSLKEGAGTLTAASGAFADTPYTFRMRFEDAPGTNPEELVAAAHAGCFSMALSANLGKAGFTPERIETTAFVSLETVNDAPTVSTSHLEVTASVPGVPQDVFDKVVEETRVGCPISRLLKAEITASAKLRS